MAKKIIIGTRGSKLALWQAYHVQDRLEQSGANVEIKIIKTQGDKIQHLSFDKMEGKGFFTKEIEAALLDKSIDLAVHSHKDLETTSPEGLITAAVSEREDPSDTLLINPAAYDASKTFALKEGAIIGTSSARRKTQLLSFRPDCATKDVRGNVQTRIQKLRDGNYDAIVLATAGLKRVTPEVSGLEVLALNPKEFIPAPAQGVLGLQIRESDVELKDLLIQNIHQRDVQTLINEERKVLKVLDGGCQLPLGSYCYQEDGVFHLQISLGTGEKTVQRVHKQSGNPQGLADEVLAELQKKKLS